MLLSELMAGITPSPTYEGAVTADDMVLALNLASTPATSPTGYIVCDDGRTSSISAGEKSRTKPVRPEALTLPEIGSLEMLSRMRF